MENSGQIYLRKTYVCWPIKIGMFSATWPFGKIVITKDYIEVGSSLYMKYQLKKTDIKNIEFGADNFCKITSLNNSFPKWLAFMVNAEDREKLIAYGFPIDSNIKSSNLVPSNIFSIVPTIVIAVIFLIIYLVFF